MTDRYYLHPGSRIYPGGHGWMTRALKDAYEASKKDNVCHVLEAIEGDERAILRIYREGNDVTKQYKEELIRHGTHVRE